MSPSAAADTTQGFLQSVEGRAARPSLFLAACAGVALLAASLLPAHSYLGWGGLALLLLALRGAPVRRFPANALSLGLALFCAWLFASAAFFTPHYSANGLYRPMVLFLGFAVAATMDREALEPLLRAAVGLLAGLVLIGLLQQFLGFWHLEQNPERAAATFVTPNTFATAINLVLLPLVALAATGRGGWKNYVFALWLFAGLLSTQSRGGWISFLAGVALVAA